MVGEYGHSAWSGPGGFIDGWGAGLYVLTYAGKTYRFEDSDRFGPVPVGLDGEPTDKGFSENSPFWNAWFRWRDEGRKTIQGGKPTRAGVIFEHCVYTDMRKRKVGD